MAGYIKLYKKFNEWGWYKNVNMVKLFIHLLISANYEDKIWMGKPVKRGQLITGRLSLATETGLNESTVRTCLKKLENTGEINQQITNKYTLLTVCKYDEYQTNEKEKKTKPAIKIPTDDQQNTTTKELKEIENIRTKFLVPIGLNSFQFLKEFNVLLSQSKWKNKPITAIQKSLDKLSNYDVNFSILLVEQSIANNYQGVVFPDTDERYQKWQNLNNSKQGSTNKAESTQEYNTRITRKVMEDFKLKNGME